MAGPEMAQGFLTQVNANAKDIGSLVATVERFAGVAMQAVAGMKAHFSTGADQAEGADAQATFGRHRAGGQTAGQTTLGSIEDLTNGAAQRIYNGYKEGRSAGSGGYGGPNQTPVGTPTVQNVGQSGGAGGRGGDRSGGNAPPPGNAAVPGAGAAALGMGGGGGGSTGEGGGGGAGGGGGGGGGVPGGYGATPGGTAVAFAAKAGGPTGPLALGLKALDEFHSQTAKGDYYRNIEGGSWMNAVGERGREELLATRTMGVFSGAEASQTFKGVTRLGYTNRSDQRSGTKRQEVIDYVYDAKKSRGQSVEAGLEQAAVASKALHVSFSQLNTTMENLYESAGKAGVNTEMVAKQMTNLMDLGMSKGLGGGSVGVAGAISQTTASGGKAYAQTLDNSGMYSKQMMYRMAANSGKTAMQIATIARNNPAEFLKLQAPMQAQGMAAAGVTPEMKEWVKTRLGDTDIKNNPSEAETIANEFLEQFGGQLDYVNFTASLSKLAGKDFGENVLEAAQFVVMTVAGETDAGNAAKTQGGTGKTDLSGKSKATGEKSAMVSSSLEKFGDLTTTTGPGGIGKRDQALAAQSYVKGARKSGERSGVIEKMLQDKTLQGDRGDETHVKVSTKAGVRIVSLEDAIKNYPNEVATGQVSFVDGEARGKTVQDLAGAVDTSEEGKAGAKTEQKGGPKKGEMTEAQYESKYGKIQSDKAGATKADAGEIGLSDEARRWFTIKQGDTPVNAAAAAGAPVAGSTNGSRSSWQTGTGQGALGTQ